MLFLTVSQTAKSEHITAYKLRSMIHRGECPGFYSGSRFYVNVDRLRAILDGSTSRADRLESRPEE